MDVFPKPIQASRGAPIGRPRSGGRGVGVFLAWLVILSCTAYATWRANHAAPIEAASTTQPDEGQPLINGMEGAARVMLGLGEWVSPDLRPMLVSQSEALRNEGPKERMVLAILAADLSGLVDANVELDAVESGKDTDRWVARSATDKRLLQILRALYAPDAATRTERLSNDDAAFLAEHLRWFGELAPLVRGLHGDTPEREALVAPIKRGPIAVMTFGVWMLVCGTVGLAGLIVLLVMGVNGRLRHGFGESTGRGWVYAESFAVWLGLFFALTAVNSALMKHIALPDALLLLPTLVVQCVCLAASLCWASFRVGSLAMVCADVGLHRGRGFITEALAGVLSYCMALPLLLVGLLMTMALMAVQRMIEPDAPPPSHPVQELLMGEGWLLIVVTMLTGAVVAPIAEEAAFRGMLFRHLREASGGRAGLVFSFVVSACTSSVIFATIHPQGWTFIPVLSSLAIAFCLAREWRGSLIAGMVAHGINNFVIMTLGLMLFRG